MNLKRKAFTLIEISIVLVIIGIILASVMKGRDLIKSSQIKEYNQVFISQWVTIANSYFSRMGANIADGPDNGGNNAQDGFMDNDLGALVITEALDSAGIDVCNLIKTDITSAALGCTNLNPYEKTIEGEAIGKVTTDVSFYSRTIDGKRRNQLRIRYMPEDVAQAIDTIIDGKPDGKSGNCVKLSGGNGPAEDWGDLGASTTMYIILDN